MKKVDSRKLKSGIYKIHWKSGGSSIASIGVMKNGDRWLAPTNWVEPDTSGTSWKNIDRMEKLRIY